MLGRIEDIACQLRPVRFIFQHHRSKNSRLKGEVKYTQRKETRFRVKWEVTVTLGFGRDLLCPRSVRAPFWERFSGEPIQCETSLNGNTYINMELSVCSVLISD